MNNVILTKVEYFKNVKDYKFTHKLTPEQKEEIINKLTENLKEFKLINLNNIDEKTHALLTQNSLIYPNINNILFDSKSNVCINLFGGEHLNIVGTTIGYNEECFARVKAVADKLNSKISFAYNDEYGYLMSDLNKVGAGLRVECFIALDAIKALGKIEQVKQNVKKLGCILQETNIASVYSLSTMCNLGLSEQEIFDDISKTIAKLQELEVESCKMLQVSNEDELIDKTLRSLAILKSAYVMNYEELQRLTINLMLGNNLKITDVKEKTMNSLVYLSLEKHGEFLSQTDLKNLAQRTKEILKGEENV